MSLRDWASDVRHLYRMTRQHASRGMAAVVTALLVIATLKTMWEVRRGDA